MEKLVSYIGEGLIESLTKPWDEMTRKERLHLMTRLSRTGECWVNMVTSCTGRCGLEDWRTGGAVQMTALPVPTVTGTS